MANTAQARKRVRQAERNRQRNASQRSEMRTSIKKVLSAIDGGDKELASSAFKQAVPLIDKAAGRGLIHKNKAARHKRRLNQHIREMEATAS